MLTILNDDAVDDGVGDIEQEQGIMVSENTVSAYVVWNVSDGDEDHESFWGEFNMNMNMRCRLQMPLSRAEIQQSRLSLVISRERHWIPQNLSLSMFFFSK